MEMTAHQKYFGVNEDDEPFTFLWTRDDELDYVYSLTRPVDSDNETPIEFMVLDQVWEPVADFRCRIYDDCIRAEVPVALREHTSNSSEIVVYHRCTGKALRELIDVMRVIFEGKNGLEVHV